jgi:hypothetical protein
MKCFSSPFSLLGKPRLQPWHWTSKNSGFSPWGKEKIAPQSPPAA